MVQILLFEIVITCVFERLFDKKMNFPCYLANFVPLKFLYVSILYHHILKHIISHHVSLTQAVIHTVISWSSMNLIHVRLGSWY